MEFLKLLEGLRTPFFDFFFSLITKFGEETILIVLGLVFFWCISKRHGYYIMLVGFFGTLLNLFFKIVFRVPRPWVKDPGFTIVESARTEASGYSFPSGHTQISVGVFGCIAKAVNSFPVRVLSIVLCILVPFSRLYLGVHTPADVFTSIILALLLVFLFYPIIYKATNSEKNIRILFLVLLAATFSYILFVEHFPFPADLDSANYEMSVVNAYKIFGCVAGLFIGFELDSRYIRFETKAPFLIQVSKLVLGLIPVLLIKTFLKAPLNYLFNGSFIADTIRYFILTLFASAIWPLTFKYFSRMKKS